MATLSRGVTFGAAEEVTNTKLHNLVDDGTVSSIVNADIAAGAAIVDTKLAQITTDDTVHMSSIVETLEAQGDVLVHNGTRYARVGIGGTTGQDLVTDPTDAAWGQVSMVNGVTGTLPSANGGTGSTLVSWVKFNGTGANGAKTPSASLNVTCVNKDATGIYTITWATDYGSANYFITGSSNVSDSTSGLFVTSQAAGTAVVKLFKQADNSAGDNDAIYVLAIGDR